MYCHTLSWVALMLSYKANGQFISIVNSDLLNSCLISYTVYINVHLSCCFDYAIIQLLGGELIIMDVWSLD